MFIQLPSHKMAKFKNDEISIKMLVLSVSSVTRLGDFLKFLLNNFGIIVAQIFSDIQSYFAKQQFHS